MTELVILKVMTKNNIEITTIKTILSNLKWPKIKTAIKIFGENIKVYIPEYIRERLILLNGSNHDMYLDIILCEFPTGCFIMEN